MMHEEERYPLVEGLVLRLSRISDVRQRSYALAERLKEVENELAVDVLGVIWERVLKSDEDFVRLYNGLIVTGILAAILGSGRMSQLVDEAQLRGEYSLVAILLDLPHEGSREIPHQPFLDGALKETPLGMRKALARRPDFRLIQRIARDQDHRVIRQLLDNPRLTEKDVVMIGATRPTSPKVLAAIYDHPKWISRYSVKKVVVLSPYSPLSLALRLLAFMSLEDLEQVRVSPELHEVVQQQAERIIEQKNKLFSRWGELRLSPDFSPCGEETGTPMQ